MQLTTGSDLRVLVSLLGGALRLTGWIAQRKDDGTVVKARHHVQDVFSESPTHRCHACSQTTGAEQKRLRK